MSNQSVYDQVWSLVEGLSPRTSKLVAYDGYGEVSPVINGVFLWDIVSQRCNEMTLPTEVEKDYRLSFSKLSWKTEYVVSQEASYSMRKSGGAVWQASPEKGYEKYVPVLDIRHQLTLVRCRSLATQADDWALPVLPKETTSIELELDRLLEVAKKEYLEKEIETIKQQVWQEWLDLATANQ